MPVVFIYSNYRMRRWFFVKYLYSKLMLTNFEFEPLESSPCAICSCYKNLKDNNYPFRIPKEFA